MMADSAIDLARRVPEIEFGNAGHDPPMLLYPRRQALSVLNVKFYCIINLRQAAASPRIDDRQRKSAN